MATQVRHKKPLRNAITIRLSDEQVDRFNKFGKVLYIRALINADITRWKKRKAYWTDEDMITAMKHFRKIPNDEMCLDLLDELRVKNEKA